MSLKLRPATAQDSAQIIQFIQALALYEKEPDAATVTEADLLRDGFGEQPLFQVELAEWKGQPAGFAFYFFNYSTWLGKNGLYLEDLYVSPEHRQAGAGKALLKHLARIALKNNCGRFEWSVLDWNEPAIRFYQSLGAKAQDEWVAYRLQGEEIETLARS